MNIQWQYFFGGCDKRSFDRYYRAEIKGVHVEMHHSQKGIEYSIGNIDKAKKKFKKEEKLIKAITSTHKST